MSIQNHYQIRKLGDVHNFGKSTFLRSDGKIVKPRNTAWEAALLSTRSPLRQHVDNICRAAGMAAPLPDIHYQLVPDGGSAVSCLSLASVESLNDTEIESLGVLMAIAVWFGMTDLTAENVVIGRTKNILNIGPTDLESLLIPVRGLSDTGLFPVHGQSDQHAGLAAVRDQIRTLADTRAPAVLIGAFSSLLSLLHQNRHELSLLMSPLLSEPIRIKRQSPDFYRTHVNKTVASNKQLSGLLNEEIRQLQRGDMPYFFGLAGQSEVWWFDTPESVKTVLLDSLDSKAAFTNLPRWPLVSSNEDLSTLTRNCVQEIISFFWNERNLNTTHSGIEISNDLSGIRISSSGHYVPVGQQI